MPLAQPAYQTHTSEYTNGDVTTADYAHKPRAELSTHTSVTIINNESAQVYESAYMAD